MTMRRSVLAVAWLAAHMVAAPAPAAAQVCHGQPPLSAGRANLGAGAASYTYAHALDGSIAVGRRAFATLGAAYLHDSEIFATAYDARAFIGYDLALAATEQILYLCPGIGFTHMFGPRNRMLTPRSYHSRDAYVRLGAAAVIDPAAAWRFTPFAAASVHQLRLTQTHPSPTTPRIRWNETYGLVTAGVGITWRERWTMRPAISVPFGFPPPRTFEALTVPFGREDGELGLSVSISYLLGRSGDARREDFSRDR